MLCLAIHKNKGKKNVTIYLEFLPTAFLMSGAFFFSFVVLDCFVFTEVSMKTTF